MKLDNFFYLLAQQSAEQVGLSVEYTIKFSNEVAGLYREATCHFTSNQEACSYIYENKIKEAHSIYKISENSFIVIPEKIKLLLNTQTGKELAESLKLTPWLISEEVSKVGASVRLFKEKLDKRFLSSRKYSNEPKPAPNYPSEQVLQKFYECERKVAYLSHAEAFEKCETNHVVYECSYKNHWHQGTPKSDNWQDKPYNVQLAQWQTIWRRHKGI